MALLEPGEAANAYKAKILRYQAGADFLALQMAAPEKLASLTGDLSRTNGPFKNWRLTSPTTSLWVPIVCA
jgi:hypothetical protein